MTKKDLIKKLEKLKKQALKDCWGYHKDLIKDNIGEDESLEHYLYDVSLENWEDVGFFIGYLRGLDDGIEQVEKLK